MTRPLAPNNWTQLEPLVDAILDAAPEERPALLDTLSRGDAARRRELEQLVADDPGIAILVLAAGQGDKGPGPLVTHFAAHNRLHVLVTIVPGAMTAEEIVAVA